MKEEEFLKHPAMSEISPEKKLILLEFVRQTKNMSIDKMLPILAQTNAKMKSLGLSFTKQETDLVFDVLTSDMKAADKQRLDALRRLM